MTFFQSCLPHTDCEDGEIACPLGRIDRFGRIDTIGGRCINESLVCNGIRDCGGGTDEVDCGPSKTFIAVNLIIVMSGRMLVMYLWPSRVEIDHDSVMYFDHITAFETL